MRFGVFLGPIFPGDMHSEAAYTLALDMARTARDSGFDGLFVGQHYLVGPSHLAEGVRALRTLWSDDGATFEGAHARCTARATCCVFAPVWAGVQPAVADATCLRRRHGTSGSLSQRFVRGSGNVRTVCSVRLP